MDPKQLKEFLEERDAIQDRTIEKIQSVYTKLANDIVAAERTLLLLFSLLSFSTGILIGYLVWGL